MNIALGIIICLLIAQIFQNDARLSDVTKELRKLREELDQKDFFNKKGSPH